MEYRLKSNSIEKSCKQCNTVFTGLKRAEFCSEKCRHAARLQKKNYGILGVDYIECPVCKSHVRQITVKHAKMHGFKDAHDMQQQLNLAAITCSEVKQGNSGKNNPAYNHGGKFSKFSKNFIHGYDEEWHANLKEINKKNRKENPELYPNTLQYWINKANGDEPLGQQMYYQHQAKNLAFFVKKYGEEEGTKRHKEKTEKWIKSFKKQNFSKISQQLFDELVKRLSSTAYVYYATFDRPDMQEYVNKEYRLELGESYVLPDFIDTASKKIIEFDGEYSHGLKKANPEREALRDNRIIDAGYSILHISEVEYKKDKQKVIDKCIHFLTQ
jgi:hypothetical protein